MLFFLKLVIKLIRLSLRAITFPFRFAVGLVRDSGSTRGAAEGDHESSLATDTDSEATTDSGIAESSGSNIGATSVAEARTHLRRFEYGLYGLGALMTISGLFVLSDLMGSGVMPSAIQIGTIGTIAFGGIPLVAGLGVRRGSTTAYYVGMAYLVLIGLSVVLFIPIVAAIGYFGYSGRPLLGEDVPATLSDKGRTIDAPSTMAAESGTVSDTDADAVSNTGSESATPVESGSSSADAPAAGLSSSPEVTTPDRSESSDAQPAGTSTTPTAGQESAPADDDEADSATAGDDHPQRDRDESEPVSGTTAAEEALTGFEERLTAAEAAERRAACEELAEAIAAEEVPVDAAVASLVTRLEDDDESTVRRAACEALGVAGTPRAERALKSHRLDPDTATSKAASRALRSDTPG